MRETKSFTPTKISNAINFFRVSPQLHGINLALAGLFGIPAYSDMRDGNFIFAALEFAPLAFFGATNILKSFQNLHNYNKIRRSFSLHGWDERPASTMTDHWCDRYAAVTAAHDEGYGKEMRRYLRRQGKSWLKL